MSIGRIVTLLVVGLILGIFTGLITRNILIGVSFPILLIIFSILSSYFKNDSSLRDIPVKEKKLSKEKDTVSPPPEL